MEESLQLKAKLIAHCRAHVDRVIDAIRSSMANIDEARANETKSSSPEEFEPGIALMQMEEDKLATQLAENLKVRQILDVIEGRPPSEKIVAGSLVATNRGLYFLAIGIGKCVIDGTTVFCTSLESPIGRAMNGKVVGDAFTLNDASFEVTGLV
ncbi:hypothetical protein QWY85_16615 [Neolewinella lacunae]|uniref:Uncharacterized protein n=1 Tax=Neolewinella lacunae TaxID=1517758 RepID=A0A923T800_9BACT|nr:hypothetical protein [Neolewinella lacunae]MBC6993433.1 hypothetical protein [Neolewinella lacunae]MDN3636291.1 hypothetical protein [Neolewinella lacunae]